MTIELWTDLAILLACAAVAVAFGAEIMMETVKRIKNTYKKNGGSK